MGRLLLLFWMSAKALASPVELVQEAAFLHSQCPHLIKQIAHSAKFSKNAVVDWYHGSKPIPQAEFDALRTTRLQEYFPSNVVTPEGLKKFSENLLTYVSEVEKTTNGGKSLPDEKEARDRILGTLESHLNRPVPPHWATLRLDDLFSQVHRSIREPRAGRAAMGPARAYRAAKRFPKHVGTGAATIIAAQALWNVKMIMYNGTDVLNLPFQNFVNQFMSHYFGFIGEGLTLALNEVQESAFNLFSEQANKTLNDLSRKLSEFEDKKIDELELDEFARESKKVFLKTRTALYAHLPDMIAVGRNYFTNGFMFFPMTFQNAASTTNIEVMMYEDRIELWKDKGNVPQEKIEREERKLAQARKRMGTILALREIHVLFYPEYTSKFMDKHGHKISHSFETISDGLGFAEYGKEYIAEMRQMLDLLGAAAKTGDLKPFLEAEKKLAEKVADIAGVPLVQSKPQ